MSLGLVGRIVVTLLLAVMPAMFLLWTLFPFGIVFVVAAWPILLAAIWKKTPIRSEEGPE